MQEWVALRYEFFKDTSFQEDIEINNVITLETSEIVRNT